MKYILLFFIITHIVFADSPSLPPRQWEAAWKKPYLFDTYNKNQSNTRPDIFIKIPKGECIQLNKNLYTRKVQFYLSQGTPLMRKITPSLNTKDKNHWIIQGHPSSISILKLEQVSHDDLKQNLWVSRNIQQTKTYPPRRLVWPKLKKRNTVDIHLSHPSRSERYAWVYPNQALQLDLKTPTWLSIQGFQALEKSFTPIYESGFMVLASENDQGAVFHRWTSRPESRRHLKWGLDKNISQAIQWTPNTTFSGNVKLHVTQPILCRILEFDVHPYAGSDNLLFHHKLWKDALLNHRENRANLQDITELEPFQTLSLENLFWQSSYEQTFNPLDWIEKFRNNALSDSTLNDFLSDLSTRFRWHRNLNSLNNPSVDLPFSSFKLKNTWGNDQHLQIDKVTQKGLSLPQATWVALTPSNKTTEFEIPLEPFSRNIEILVSKPTHPTDLSFKVTSLDQHQETVEVEYLKLHHALFYEEAAKKATDLSFNSGNSFIRSSSIKLSPSQKTKTLKIELLSLQHFAYDEKPVWISARQEAARKDPLKPQEIKQFLSWSNKKPLLLFDHLLHTPSIANKKINNLSDLTFNLLGHHWSTILHRIQRESDFFKGESPIDKNNRLVTLKTDPSQLDKISSSKLKFLMLQSSINSPDEKKYEQAWLTKQNLDLLHEKRMGYECWKVWRDTSKINLRSLATYLYQQSYFSEALDIFSLLNEPQDQPYIKAISTKHTEVGSPFSWLDETDQLPNDLTRVSLSPVSHWAHSTWAQLEKNTALKIKLEGPAWYRCRIRPVFQKGEIKSDLLWDLGINSHIQHGFIPSYTPSNTLRSIDDDLIPGTSWSKRFFIPKGLHTFHIKSHQRDLLLDLDKWTTPLNEIIKDDSSISPHSSTFYPVKKLGVLKHLINLNPEDGLDAQLIPLIAKHLHELPKDDFYQLMSRRFRKFIQWRTLESLLDSSGFVDKKINGWNPFSLSGQAFTESLSLKLGGPYKLIETESKFSQVFFLDKKQSLNIQLHLKSNTGLLEAVEVTLRWKGLSKKLALDSTKTDLNLSLNFDPGEHEITFEINEKVAGHAIVFYLTNEQNEDLLYKDKSLRFHTSTLDNPITHKFSKNVWLRLDEWTENGILSSFNYLEKGQKLQLLTQQKPRAWRISELIPSFGHKSTQITETSLTEKIESTLSPTELKLQQLYKPRQYHSKLEQKSHYLGTWEVGLGYRTGISDDEERTSTQYRRFDIFSKYRYHNEVLNNYHKSQLRVSHFNSGEPLFNFSHQLSHDHRTLPLTSIWKIETSFQEPTVSDQIENSSRVSLELSRPIRWTPRLSRRPSLQFRYTHQSLKPGHGFNRSDIAPQIYSRYRHEHAFQTSIGERFTYLEKENLRWSFSARLIGNHAGDFYKPDQSWLRIRREQFSSYSITRLGLRAIQRFNDEGRSSSSFDPVLNFDSWLFGEKWKKGFPILYLNLNHGLRDQETKLKLELSFYFDNWRYLKDHRESDPSFLSYWKKRLLEIQP